MINFVKHCSRFAGQELRHTLLAFPLGQQIQCLIFSPCHIGRTDQILVVANLKSFKKVLFDITKFFVFTDFKKKIFKNINNLQNSNCKDLIYNFAFNFFHAVISLK
jgi:hypothetical protein